MKKERASERINTWLENLALKDIEIKEFVRETDLTNLPGNVAYQLIASMVLTSTTF